MGIFNSLKKRFKLFKDKNLIGLDIGDETIKLTEVYSSWGNIVLNNLAIIPVPDDTVKNGDLNNIIKLEEKLGKVLKEKEFQAKKVVAAISGEQVISRMVDIPNMSEEELNQAVKWEASEKLPIQIEDAVLDYEILERKEGRGYQVLLIAVKKDLINKYLRLFESLGLEPVAIEIEPIAMARTIDKLYMARTIGVIDIGIKTTDISILNEGKLLFTRTIGLGGESITEDISETHNYSFEEAEDYKKRNNLFNNNDTNLIVRNLITSIYRSLDYFQVKYKGVDIDKVVLTGGGANLMGFDRYLTKEFGVRVEKLNLSYRLRSELASDKYLSEVAQLLGVSVGLALREEGKNDKFITSRLSKTKKF
ncbi:pilus assembly protein PilM [Orenia metallireducens]|uniref:Pilus assembly protein PilM n=1 Tax=Orenia metallireducens TaxID=1413210 RepID=A0A1C0ACN5_9FIRM|nr:type IV pilus assembly protein PilM [Orenia metallireducens]OCL28135.1 pilus assembly protein PilM [Orenia metallireducens]